MSERRNIKGDPRPWGEVTCGYGKTEPECDAPATRHFMWLDGYEVAGACDEHAEFIRRTSEVATDEHAFAADCSMPGAVWQFAYTDDDESWCAFPAPDDAALLAEEPIPALAAVDERTADA